MRPDVDPEPPPPLTIGQLVLLALGATFLRSVLAVLLGPATGGGPAVVGVATLLAFGAALAMAAPRIPEPPGTSLGFTRAPTWAWLAVPFLIPSLLLISELENVVRPLGPVPPQAPDAVPTSTLESALVLIAVIPLCEEVFFRGLVQPVAVRSLGRLRGVALVAALHGAAWGLPGLVYGLGPFVIYACIGGVLGLLREAGRSLLPPLLLASAFGAVLVLASVGALGIAGFDDTGADHTPLAWLAPAALLVGVGLGFCRLADGAE